MKKTFTAPSLKYHGLLGEVTQAYGASSAKDFIQYGSTSFPGNGGSQDGVVIPRP
jgi:hypothetical protein